MAAALRAAASEQMRSAGLTEATPQAGHPTKADSEQDGCEASTTTASASSVSCTGHDDDVVASGTEVTEAAVLVEHAAQPAGAAPGRAPVLQRLMLPRPPPGGPPSFREAGPSPRESVRGLLRQPSREFPNVAGGVPPSHVRRHTVSGAESAQAAPAPTHNCDRSRQATFPGGGCDLVQATLVPLWRQRQAPRTQVQILPLPASALSQLASKCRAQHGQPLDGREAGQPAPLVFRPCSDRADAADQAQRRQSMDVLGDATNVATPDWQRQLSSWWWE
jgi:hypothetical protein